MTDNTPGDPDAAGGDRPTPRRPAASPTSRARRIGGRPSPARPAAGVVVDKPAEPTTSAVAPSAPPAPPPPAVAPSPPPAAPDAKQSPETAADLQRRLARLRWMPAAVIGAAVVVLLVLAGVFSRGGYWAKPDGSAGVPTQTQQRVLASAKTCFARVNTYDYRKLPTALRAGVACTTGKFTSDYRTAFTQSIEADAPTAKATQSAQVNRAGISAISPDGNQWTVLVYGQLQVTNVSITTKSPRIDPFGAVVTMDRVGSRWLIAKVDYDTGSLSGS